ncbi:MAG: peptide chain release factor N(5)-glutamine methyltransferase [Oscillospiraceae bacterium]|nr:peptide chain release factor N(5)-glutamine methyltransferase [Oscillospiraceae bacterium]
MVKQYGALYVDARRALLETEDAHTAGFLARQLLCHVSGKSQEAILADRELYASEAVCKAMDDGVRRLLTGEPLAYVLGEWDFYGLTLRVDKNVLIPRDDTCAVAQLAISQGLFLDQDPRILDLCCGSGCIGLAVATKVKDAKVTLADLSKEALAVAKENTTKNKLSGRVRCVQVDALKPAPAFLGKFDMIVSNPPYITGQEMQELPPSVKNFEPHMALYGGEDGLDFYRAIAANFTSALKPGGYLALEFGMGQGDDVCRILAENGYTILERTRDYNDRERAVLARYGRKEE